MTLPAWVSTVCAPSAAGEDVSDDFKIKSASDVVFCVAVPGTHTFLFMALRLELKVSCELLALIIVLLMGVVMSQGCLMDTKHHGLEALWISHSFSDLVPSLSN